MTFSAWLDTFISEKGLDPELVIEAEGPSGTNFIPLSQVISAVKSTPRSIQAAIKTALTRCEDEVEFFEGLAKTLAI